MPKDPGLNRKEKKKEKTEVAIHQCSAEQVLAVYTFQIMISHIKRSVSKVEFNVIN